MVPGRRVYLAQQKQAGHKQGSTQECCLLRFVILEFNVQTIFNSDLYNIDTDYDATKLTWMQLTSILMLLFISGSLPKF